MSHDHGAKDFRFGRFLLRPHERQLLDEGRRVALEPRAFDLLTTLVERAGQLVTKDELLASVWPGRVVEDGNLHVHVSSLRKVLGKDAVATVARHGYRFTGMVEVVGAQLVRPPVHASNLPQPLGSFIGREDDLLRLVPRLEQDRLVTLTGIGGCGKTRLAIKLAERVVASFPDGVCFVDLAQVAEPESVARAVASVLDVREESDRPMAETLTRHCFGRRMLIVLDNCEHLVAACASLVEDLLTAVCTLCVLATSRERLGVAGEWVVPVRALTIPPSGVELDAVALAEYESVRLFVERARQVAPEFVLGAGNTADVVKICRRLDGIPLALELAAALVKLLTVEQICARLDDRFRLLTGGSRTVARHQTLLATLTSSYASLTPDEQACFDRLSVFAGGWTLEAATALAGEADEIDMLNRLGALVDKSLVHVDRTVAGGPRYGMLETVREFAGENLEASGASEQTRERHLDHFAEFARNAQSHLFGDAMRQWLALLDADLPNLLAAHAWCDQASDGVHRGLELATNLRTYWLARGLFAFGQRVYEEALARKGGNPRAMQRGKALYALGQHHYVRGRLRDALAPTQEALSIAREHGDDEWVVYCLDRICLASSWLGDTVLAGECCAEELIVARRTGKPRLEGFALTAKGAICRAQGHFEAAAQAFEQALTVFDSGQDLHNRYNALVDVARASIALGARDRARETLAAAIRLVGDMGTTYRGHFALEAAARLAAACEDWRLAARLQGASDAVVDRMGGTRTWFDDPILAALHDRPVAMLEPGVYADAYDGGRGLALEAAFVEAAAWFEQAEVWDRPLRR